VDIDIDLDALQLLPGDEVQLGVEQCTYTCKLTCRLTGG
jgi:hypothetical protein